MDLFIVHCCIYNAHKDSTVQCKEKAIYEQQWLEFIQDGLMQSGKVMCGLAHELHVGLG